MTETYVIKASVPPYNLPHKTRNEEIAELPSYLVVEATVAEGTERVVVDPAQLGPDNQDKIYIERDEATNEILSIRSYVGGEWKRWEITTEDLSEDALASTLKISDSKIAVNLDATLPLRDADTDGKQAIYAKPNVDDETIAYGTRTDGKEQLKIKDNVYLTTPRFFKPQVFEYVDFNLDTDYEFQIGSNASDGTPDAYQHCWLGSWNGIPFDVYIQDSVSEFSLYTFHKDYFLISNEPGTGVKISTDAEGNVFHETATGGSQNVVWKNSRVGGEHGVAMLLEASEAKLFIKRLNLSNIPTSVDDPTLVSGDVWSDNGVLNIKS